MAWVAGVFFGFGLKVRWADGLGHYRLMFAMSEVGLQSTNSFDWPTEFFWDRRYWSLEDGLLGEPYLSLHDASRDEWYDAMINPVPWLIIAVLPFAIGPLLAFRFCSWHYLAYTSLIAVELAFYLRWQG